MAARAIFFGLLNFLISSIALAQLPPSENFTHNAVLDNNGDFRVWWKFNDTYITFEMQGKTTGWIGIGISPNGGMQNSDIYTGFLTSSGQVNVTDRHGPSNGNSFPPIDANQNVENLGGTTQNGWTRIKFRRPIVSCDPEDITITESTMRMIYAYGTSNGPDINYHGSTDRGTKSLIILSYGENPNPYPPGETEHFSFDLLSTNFAVPAESTYYNCKLLKIPENITTKHHVVTIAPVVQSGNEAYVHHILLYACYGFENTTNLNQDAKCFSPNMPGEFYGCGSLMAAWAIGGTEFDFPYHAGYPIGDVDSPKFVLMETHYDNPDMRTDIVDSSGLNMVYTPQLRDNDAGIMAVGHIVSPLLHMIPPAASSFLSSGECSPQCIQQALNVANQPQINIFASMLHSHLLGKVIEVEQIRNGVEMAPIALDENYDFNYQETRWLPQERVVLPTDTLRTICTYDSRSRQNMTFGGLGTYEEMCMSFLFYYPKIPLTDCSSGPLDVRQIWSRYFGIYGVSLPDILTTYTTLYDVNVTQPASLAGQTVADVMNAQNWNKSLANDFSNMLASVPAMQRCFSLPNETFAFNFTTIDVPYVPPPSNCDVTTTTTTTTTTDQTTSGTITVKFSLFLFSMILGLGAFLFL